jgi:SagB-type dehydrogenase family enzyme
VIRRYHDGTKHHFHRFARSLGYLDWASQPHPFRSFDGAASFLLPPHPGARPSLSPIGPILRHALGLTAWKAFGGSRWALRANPSSGNLHPTEAYVVSGALDGIAPAAGVYHYAPDRHVLERRCAFRSDDLDGERFLIALTSIHWREAWKYGERAFRYCQHDLGHAIAAVGLAAALAGWRVRLLPDWSHADIAALSGIDRDGDYVDAEREEPGALVAVFADAPPASPEFRVRLLGAARAGTWSGRANQLSEAHVQWTFIDEIAAATRDPGRPERRDADDGARRSTDGRAAAPGADAGRPPFSARLIRQRRSAVAFDGRSSIPREEFLAMLRRVMPDTGVPFEALWWSPRIHLALFVHRVDDLAPGLYLLPREAASGRRLAAALGRDFLFEPVATDPPLVLLARGDARALAQRVSCDQAIASDGFFSLGMIAEFDRSLAEFGDPFYRHLFWESGVVGQALYLAAEAAGARATGIGCFYDDPVHDVLGLTGHAFQSLYHFSVGIPVEDTRLTTASGYDWE